MSYNIGIIKHNLPKDFAKACALFEKFADSDAPDTIDPVYLKFHDEITKIFPCICSLPDNEVDNGVWCDGPLIGNFKTNGPVIGFVFSKVEEALPVVVESALKMGLCVLDWQAEMVYTPNDLMGKW
jgi:hypothetical protein